MDNERDTILKQISEYADNQLHKVMIILSIIILFFVCLGVTVSPIQDIIYIILTTFLLIFLPFFIIPIIIRKGLKKTFKIWQAVVYTLFFAFIFVLVTHKISILNLIIIFIPYYYLTNQPMFTNKKTKELKQRLQEING